MRSLKLLFLSATLLMPLTSCDSTKQAFGMKRSSPNELTVMKRTPLIMPSSFDLPEPEPGAKDRSDLSQPSSTETAKNIVFQSNTPSTQKNDVTEGDAAFLSRVGSQDADSTIRKKIDRESYVAEKNTAKNDENWLRDAIGMKRKEVKKGVINPKEEAEKLKKEKGDIVVKNPYDGKE